MAADDTATDKPTETATDTATDTALTTVRCWFGDVQFAALELPDGWFGPPQESRHQLTWSALEDDRLIVELDHALTLVFARVRTVARIDDVLLFKDFDALRFECRGWRGIRPEVRRYGAGLVSLTPSIGSPHPRTLAPALGKRVRNRHTGGVPVPH
jgi:hypothetical protein